MDKYSRLNSIYLGIWFAASIINGIVSALIIMAPWHEGGMAILSLSIGCSMLFSIPIIIAAMLVGAYLLSIRKWENIFHVILLLNFLASTVGAICFAWFFGMMYKSSIPLGMSIVASSIIAVVIFQKNLKEINLIQE